MYSFFVDLSAVNGYTLITVMRDGLPDMFLISLALQNQMRSSNIDVDMARSLSIVLFYSYESNSGCVRSASVNSRSACE